ncbi:NAD(P)-binding domain-containing protein [Nocardia sp. NPDC050717]|uniref:NAD(P)-dependent oxidoreductase n=1 Tax=Nocardia sp. NPDC050717 TaxID=3157221 RepID=UPI0033C40BF9
MTVTVLGLGEMGTALALATLAADQQVTVWNRSADKAAPLVDKGAREAATVAAAVAGSEVVLVNVKGGEVAAALLREAGSALAGRTVLNLTDGPSEQARATAQLVAELGADYLHGQIMTIAPAIGSPDAVIFLGGSRAAFDRHEGLLRALGGRATYVSPNPTVPVQYGMAVHDTMWGLLNGFLHASALLGKAGLSVGEFTEHAEPSLAGMLAMFPMLATEIDRAEHATPYGALVHHLPSIDDLIAESAELGIDTDLPKYSRGLVARAIEAGHRDDSYSRLVEYFRR